MVTIDWGAAAVRAILDCLDGKQAWRLLLEYVAPYRGQRIEIRDAIWERRQAAMPQRGGRRTMRRLRAPPSKTEDPVGRRKPQQGGSLSSPVSDLATFEDIRKELTRRGLPQRQIIHANGPGTSPAGPARIEQPTQPPRWQGSTGPQPGDRCAQCLGGDWSRSGSLGGCAACHPPPPSWGVDRFST
jgi:hypothetical protein